MYPPILSLKVLTAGRERQAGYRSPVCRRAYMSDAFLRSKKRPSHAFPAVRRARHSAQCGDYMR